MSDPHDAAVEFGKVATHLLSAAAEILFVHGHQWGEAAPIATSQIIPLFMAAALAHPEWAQGWIARLRMEDEDTGLPGAIDDIIQALPVTAVSDTAMT